MSGCYERLTVAKYRPADTIIFPNLKKKKLMNRVLREQFYQDITIPKAVARPGWLSLNMAGRCSSDEVSREWNFSAESLSGVSLSGPCLSGVSLSSVSHYSSGHRAELNRLIQLLITADMDKMDLVERQPVVCFGVSSAYYANQINNKHKQSNLNANGGLSATDSWRSFHEQM